jgi:hypothetical protein
VAAIEVQTLLTIALQGLAPASVPNPESAFRRVLRSASHALKIMKRNQDRIGFLVFSEQPRLPTIREMVGDFDVSRWDGSLAEWLRARATEMRMRAEKLDRHSARWGLLELAASYESRADEVTYAAARAESLRALKLSR